MLRGVMEKRESFVDEFLETRREFLKRIPAIIVLGGLVEHVFVRECFAFWKEIFAPAFLDKY